MRRWRLPGVWLALVGVLALVPVLAAQNSTPPVDRGVRIGITYTPGVRPGILVLGGPHADLVDSVRAIVRRDLDFSDRFELITLPGGDSLTLGVAAAPPAGRGAGGGEHPGGAQQVAGVGVFINYALYAALGADYVVNVVPGDSGPAVTLYDVRGEAVRRQLHPTALRRADPDFRMAVHRVSDEVVRTVAGAPGVAATQLLVVQRGRVYRLDADGAQAVPLSPAGINALSPAWAPDGRRMAYMEFANGAGRLYLYDLRSGERRIVPPTTQFLNFTPAFAPDGRLVAFSRATEEGTDIFTYNVAEQCCLQRLTIGRFSDNLSPTFSADGGRIAFISTRSGATQVYVMAADGTGQELFAPFDYGMTGSSNAPEWSPDGVNLAFHRTVEGSPQIFVMDVASRRVRQLTSFGRNEDPTWAPDGRHVAVVSDRTGSRQIWIIDLDTGRVRQLTRLGEARLPAWSPRIVQP